MSFLICENSTDYLDSIARLRLMDDDFMRIVFKDEDVVRQFLEIILDRNVPSSGMMIYEWKVVVELVLVQHRL